jgi:hypothetical protein
MNAITLHRPDHLGMFPRSRLFSGRGRPLKSIRARVFAIAREKRARVVCAGQHTLSEKAGTREQREHRAALGAGSNPRQASVRQNVPGAPAPAAGDSPLQRKDFAALVHVLETQGSFAPLPPDPAWADPRPDLDADRARWLTLLELAYRHDAEDPYGVFGALVGIRCCGAAIVSSGGSKPSWRLTRGEMTAAAWQAIRTQWLMPHLKVLQALLGTPTVETTQATQNS